MKASFSRKKTLDISCTYMVFCSPSILEPKEMYMSKSVCSILGNWVNCNHQGNHFIAFLMLVQPMCKAARASIQSRSFSFLFESNNFICDRPTSRIYTQEHIDFHSLRTLSLGSLKLTLTYRVMYQVYSGHFYFCSRSAPRVERHFTQH